MSNNPAKIYERDLEAQLKPYLDTREILSIVGPRQAGKTTLMQSLQQSLGPTQKSAFLTAHRVGQKPQEFFC